ncbi:41976_t:CDS:2 [Gigaspora margarita]|uniref:41976_t:CDS:1 n=1 Tax=Gigaspora margarita TaxID=4874 RepID=A0ABN7UA75_GIGMA|nr:41976_t:CDS:2 [Gigaspora margarita]
MPLELELLRQRIRELEVENAEIPDLRRKISEFDAERAEFKAKIAKLQRQSVEENKRRDAENTELKSKVGELEARLAIVEQETIAEMLPEIAVSDVDLSNAVKESIPEGTPLVKSSMANKQTVPASGSYEDVATECQKIPYNQKVEQDLRRELSSCTKGNDGKISKTFDIQIPELSLETILMGSCEVTAPNITSI